MPAARRATIRQRFRDPAHAAAGLASLVAGLGAASAFLALGVGPGWVGFLAGYLPASILAAWVASPRDVPGA